MVGLILGFGYSGWWQLVDFGWWWVCGNVGLWVVVGFQFSGWAVGVGYGF